MAEPRPDEDLPVPVPAPPPSRVPAALATIALLLSAAALAGILRFMVMNDKLESRLKALEEAHTNDHRGLVGLYLQVERVGSAVTALSDEQVDLMNSKLQQLRYGFAVSELSLSRKDSGVIVSGRLINGSSVTHREVIFRIKIGNASKEFAVSNLPPGTSGEFEVVLPNVPLENARTATLSKVSSAVVFGR